MAGDLCDSSRITFLPYESWAWMRVGWSGRMKGLGSSWYLADLSIWNSCLPWALSVGGWQPSQRGGDKVAATCCIDQGLQGHHRLVGQIVPLFPYLAWLTGSQESLSGEWSWGKRSASGRGCNVERITVVMGKTRSAREHKEMVRCNCGLCHGSLNTLVFTRWHSLSLPG